MRRRLESGAYDEARHAVAELTVRMLGGHTPPADGTERILAGRLRRDPRRRPRQIGADANFFDLGGTSLDILRLRSKVAQRLGAARPAGHHRAARPPPCAPWPAG